ncbi:MAG: antibiotic biosynthesis monooxygenase [Paracoccaceae bacterium]
MLIAHVTFTVALEDSRKALDALVAESDQVRAMPGSIAFIPFQDATDPQKVGVIHEWKTQQDFEDYTSSDEFARVGQTLRPMMLAPPVSHRFDATLLTV